MDSPKEAVLKTVREQGVKFIQLWFTDILGMLKSVTLTDNELSNVLSEGLGFDGSSVQGFCRIDESDMLAMPDPATYVLLPDKVHAQGGRTARMFADILTPDQKPYEGDPRYVLKRNLKKAEDLGYTFYAGPELEFFCFKDNKGTELLDQGGYFDLTPLDAAHELRQDAVIALEKMGIKAEYSHHESAPSQHEIDLRYSDGLRMADAAMTYRLIVKEAAQRRGIYATFMPKPIMGLAGNGMHVHQSLFRGEENAFFDPADEFHLSKEAKGYIAGLLKHAQEICSVVAQWVNSYKRLVPGYEAPVYVAWARRNRSSLVRVPMYKPGKAKATRLEFRCPDPACNPYLAFSVMLAAGLAGITNDYPLPAPIEEDIYEMPPSLRRRHKIVSLPGDLSEALEVSARSKLLKECLGEHVFNNFLSNKRLEWDHFRTHVSRWEVDRYLSVL